MMRSFGRLSKKRFTSTTLKAVAAAGSQIAQYVLSNDPMGWQAHGSGK